MLVNGPTQVWVDRGRGLEPAEVRFADDGEVRRLAQRLAAAAGRRLDDSSPFVDTRLPDGTRVHAALATQAVPGTCLSFRVPARRAFSLEDCIATGAVSPSLAAVLDPAGREPGWPSWSPAAPDRARPPCSRRCSRWCRRASAWWWWRTPASCVRTTRTWCSLEGRPANAEGRGAIALTDLVRQSLRMRPDRLIVGEVRGAEICDLLAAMNTGHEGGCGTVHANSAEDVPVRLEALGALGHLDRPALHAQLASALDVVVHIRRGRDGRRRVSELHVLERDPATGWVATVPALDCSGLADAARARARPGSNGSSTDDRGGARLRGSRGAGCGSLRLIPYGRRLGSHPRPRSLVRPGLGSARSPSPSASLVRGRPARRPGGSGGRRRRPGRC